MLNKSGAAHQDIAAIRDAIIEVIEDDPPMTVRQVFYQLVSRGVIEKTEKEYQQTVIRLMTEMRLDDSLSVFMGCGREPPRQDHTDLRQH
jgi:hypothetical protein